MILTKFWIFCIFLCKVVVYSLIEETLFKNNKSESKKLVCVCNDNAQCFISKQLSTKHQKNFGSCVIYHEGKCYAARVINKDALYKFLLNFDKKILQSGNLIDIKSLFKNIDLNTFIRVTYGCLQSHEKITLTCNSHFSKHVIPKAIKCCDLGDFCNFDLKPNFMYHLTDRDAIYAAIDYLNKSRNLRNQILNNNQYFFKPEMNNGPSMLKESNYLFNSSNLLNLTGELHMQNNLKTKNYLPTVYFIVTLLLVIIILLFMLLFVFLIYKHQMQKAKQKFSLIGSSKEDTFTLALKLKSSYSNNLKSWSIKNNLQDPVDFNFLSINKQSVLKIKNNLSSQTLSTDLTRNADSLSANKTRYSALVSAKNKLYLIPQTVKHQINLKKLLGKGKYSDVWLGKCFFI